MPLEGLVKALLLDWPLEALGTRAISLGVQEEDFGDTYSPTERRMGLCWEGCVDVRHTGWACALHLHTQDTQGHVGWPTSRARPPLPPRTLGTGKQ